ncbi:MAG: hypothetical protein GY787_11500 [Alteromonadales bacterium]|nr:hypothetical protein [Alteromonadales bacterium]
MDIFTTQLTRVVPVPIKPVSLKVKALLKEAANSKLTQDPDHLENHEYYFTTEEDQYHASQQQEQHEKKGTKKAQYCSSNTQSNELASTETPAEQGVEEAKKAKHLDLFV